MKTQNFTQFCIEIGFPCDYDTMFNAQLLGSRGLAGRISTRTVKKQDEAFHEMQKLNKTAHELFYNAIKNGDLLDGSGELTREKILQREASISRDETKSKIAIIHGKIQFIESLGSMSHMKNGKLKKGYQLQIDDYNKQLTELLKK